ncbi:444_t:CDS:1, partial [Gigaspora margarita]
GHYTFRKRLKSKTEETGNASKRWSNCGNIQDIGGKKTYKCDKCHIVKGRDANGARGISFARCLVELSKWM